MQRQSDRGFSELIHLGARILLLFFGFALLFFGLWDLLVPRGRFVSSSPQAGSMIADPPTAVIINFSNELSPESQIEVLSTVRLLPSGEQDYPDQKSVVVFSRLDPDDPSRRSIRADLRLGLHKGLYAVSWRTKSAGWRARTLGRMYFGAGMPVPEHIIQDARGTIWERHFQQRERRGALIGGVVLLALGFWLPRFQRQ